MMLAELSGLETSGIICSIIFGAVAVLIAGVALFKKGDTVISPQPLIVAMQKEFATKHDFDAHVIATSNASDKLFSKIGGVERGAKADLDLKVETVRREVIGIGNQVAALQSETKLQNQQLARMDAKLDRLAERKSEA